MAHLVPSISFVSNLRNHLLNGHSLAQSLNHLIQAGDGEFIFKMGRWWLARRAGNKPEVVFSTHFQKTLIRIIEEGLEGGSIFEALDALEVEMNEEFERQWKAYQERLPTLLSLPLLFLFFPSYLVLLFGPLLSQFLNGVNL